MVVVGVLALVGSLHADMTPMSPLVLEYRQSLPVWDRAPLQHTDSSDPPDGFGITGLDFLLVGPVPGLGGAAKPTREAEPAQVLTEGQSSFSLCLYALLGLGLCRSAPLVKKLSFGGVRDWYHHGGPYQIGHSYAIGPECVCAVAVCFIQPDCLPEELVPPYHRGTIASLVWKSQSRPTILASRGPPPSC
jgi:hypothetical protein